jgi:hypothetical protein
MQETTRWKKRPPGSNWGDFGKDDQAGRLNLITPEKVLQGIAEVHVATGCPRWEYIKSPSLSASIATYFAQSTTQHELCFGQRQSPPYGCGE